MKKIFGLPQAISPSINFFPKILKLEQNRGFGSQFSKFDSSVRKILQEIDQKKIVKMIVLRDPIKEEIHMLANAISMNEINKFKKEVSVDDLFHLFAVCTLDDGTMVRFEKNELRSSQ